jgi:predicted nucleic acid-binding Zn ribbon protein
LSNLNRKRNRTFLILWFIVYTTYIYFGLYSSLIDCTIVNRAC